MLRISTAESREVDMPEMVRTLELLIEQRLIREGQDSGGMVLCKRCGCKKVSSILEGPTTNVAKK
jgi:tRNA-binding EMAP/Myf-like protein